MVVESSLYGRLGPFSPFTLVAFSLMNVTGLRYLAWTRNELFLECYADKGSLEDILQFKCRAALFVCAQVLVSATVSNTNPSWQQKAGIPTP